MTRNFNNRHDAMANKQFESIIVDQINLITSETEVVDLSKKKVS